LPISNVLLLIKLEWYISIIPLKWNNNNYHSSNINKDKYNNGNNDDISDNSYEYNDENDFKDETYINFTGSILVIENYNKTKFLKKKINTHIGLLTAVLILI